MDEVAGSQTIQFFRALAEVIEDLLIDEFVFAFRRHRINEPGDAIDDQAQTEFARSQGFFHAFPVVDIRPQGIPADDTSLCVPPRQRPYMEPAVCGIGTTDTVFRLMWMPGFDRAPPRGQHASMIVGMNKVGGGPALRFETFQFVERLAKIFQGLLTDEFEFAFRCSCIDEPWNAIDDQTKALSARTQGLFRLF